MKQLSKNSIQGWLPFDKILDSGIIKLKDQHYIKILSVNPINYNLKSELEKQSILTSYELFLKTCNFDIQFIIQNNKENFKEYFCYLEKEAKKENEAIQFLTDEYIKYLKDLNSKTQSSSKKFFMIIKTSELLAKHENNEKEALKELNEKYHKIKECLARCGNEVSDYTSKLQVYSILQAFFNKKEFYQ